MHRMMMIFVSSLMLIGCQSSYHLWHEEEPFGMQDAFNKVKDKSVAVVLLDGTEFDGHLINLSGDTLHFQWEELSVPIFIKAGQVHSVTTRSNRFLPTLGGVLLGGSFGALVGVGVEPNGHHGAFEIISPHDVAIATGALVGAVLGGAIGNAASVPTKVIFSENEDRDLSMTAEQKIEFMASNVSEGGGVCRVVLSDKILRLPLNQVEIERTGGRTIVHATQKTVLSGAREEESQPERSIPALRTVYR